MPGDYALASCGSGVSPDDYFTVTAANNGTLTITLLHDESETDFIVEVTGLTGGGFGSATDGTNRKVYQKTGVSAGDQFRIYVGNVNPSNTGPYYLRIDN